MTPRAALLACVLLLGCGPDEQTTWYSEAASLELAWVGGSVLDPKLEGEPELQLELHLAQAPEGQVCAVELEVQQPGRYELLDAGLSLQVGERATLAWAGRDADGVTYDPGLVSLLAVAHCDGGAVAHAAAEAFVLRLGVVEVDFTEQPDDGGLVPLAFHKLDLLTFGLTELDGLVPEYRGYPGDSALADLDGDDGLPRQVPAPWTDPDIPPWGDGVPDASTHSLPTAYTVGSRARLEVVAGSEAVSQHSGALLPALGHLVTEADAPPSLRLRAQGLEPVDPAAPYAPGATVGFDSEPLPATLGRHQLELEWSFEALGAQGWEPIPGWQTTRHELWITAGPPALRDGSDLGFAPGVAWIGVLAELEDQLTGVDPGAATVLDVVRDAVHDDPWLIYNPSDAAYTSYSGSYIYWSYIWIDLASWLDRDDGIELYCHSMSCLLSTLVGHWGVSAPQQVLGVGFQTNLVRAAGTDSWGHWTFNSHSVVSPDDGATIWDASIDVDGDEDPYSEPVEPVSPMGMDGDEYLWRLSHDDIGIVNSGLCYFH